MLMGTYIHVTGFIRRTGDVKYVRAMTVTIVRDFQEHA